MTFDFSLGLIILTFASGVIWLLGVIFFGRDSNSIIIEYARSFFPLLLLVLVLRSFVFEPFRIPSGSMKPTLLIGDFILVNKFAYGIRLPVLHRKVIEVGEPARGDVAVFRYPQDPRLNYIKRVIGLPGDKITYQGTTLIVNGEPVSYEDVGPYTDVSQSSRGITEKIEDLVGVRHSILIDELKPRPGAAANWEVPAGHYFVMGDNRDNSNDSRVWRFVPEQNLVGKAFMIWMNFNWELKDMQWRRIGDKIQ